MTAPPAMIASAQTTGTVATGLRAYPVTAPTQPGDTLLACVGSNNASIAITGLTDPRGNTWQYDREHTTGPYTSYFRCPGRTGGPGGGPTAALQAGDTLTITASTTIAATVGMLAIRAQLGALLRAHDFTSTTGMDTISAATAQAGGGTLIALGLNQAVGGVAAFDPPLVTLGSWAQGHQYTCGYRLDAPAGPLSVMMRLAAAANARLAVYSFVTASLPLKVWDGQDWRAVARA